MDFGATQRAHTVYREVTLTAPVGESVTLAAKPSGAAVPGQSGEMYYYVSPEHPDTCFGEELAGGASCTFTLGAGPNRYEAQSADLIVPDSGGVEVARIRLRVRGTDFGTGRYTGVLPQTRVYDTRTAFSRRPVGPGQVVEIPVNVGRSDGVSAVAVNITAIGSTASSYLTAYPTGTSRPTASVLTFPKGFTGANSAIVPLGEGNRISIYNNAGNTHVAVDLVGYYEDGTVDLSGMKLQAFPSPQRWYDSRSSDGAFYGGGWVEPMINFGDQQKNLDVYAVLVNVTATSASGSGYLTGLHHHMGSPPSSSTVNFRPGQASSNTAIIRTSHDFDRLQAPYWAVQNTQRSGSVHIVIDLLGVYTQPWAGPGLRYTPTPVTRVLDTRSGLGSSGAIGSGESRAGQISRELGPDQTYAFAANLTGVAASQPTYLAAWGGADGVPDVSTLNLIKNQTKATGTVLPLGGANGYKIFNKAGQVNAVMDVSGRFDWDGPSFPSGFVDLSGPGGDQHRARVSPARIPAPQVRASVAGDR